MKKNFRINKIKLKNNNHIKLMQNINFKLSIFSGSDSI